MADDDGFDPLSGVVREVLQLPEADRELAVPAAVQTLLDSSTDGRTECAKTLLKAIGVARARLPANASALLTHVEQVLNDELQSAECTDGLGVGASDTATCGDVCSEQVDDADNDSLTDEDSQPFCLGPVQLPLATLMNITNCLEPDDLNPAAAACKSLCIPININLQYLLFLVRLLRLIVFGPELARLAREQEDAEDSGESTSASSDED